MLKTPFRPPIPKSLLTTDNNGAVGGDISPAILSSRTTPLPLQNISTSFDELSSCIRDALENSAAHHFVINVVLSFGDINMLFYT